MDNFQLVQGVCAQNLPAGELGYDVRRKGLRSGPRDDKNWWWKSLYLVGIP